MSDVLQQATMIVDALQKVRDEALHHGRIITEKGKGIDDHQVHAERLAYLSQSLLHQVYGSFSSCSKCSGCQEICGPNY